jgi:phage terminase large subunit GpA-like protein
MIAFRGRAPGSVKTLYTVSHSGQERAPVLSGTVQLAKDLLSNLLRVQAPGRGYIHIPADPARGFDATWSAEMTAEKKVVKYRAGQRIAMWEKRPGARNEAWDLLVMTLILAESLQLNLENREPDYYSEVAPSTGAVKFGAQNLGAIDPSLLIGYGVTPRPDVQHSDHNKPRWGVQNSPITW